MPIKPLITIDDFAKLDLRMATITAVDLVEGADKLYRITLDVGELGERTIVSGLKPWYAPEELVGKQIIYLANLEPRLLRGVESQGMLIAAGTDRAVLLHPDQLVDNGSGLR